MPSRTSDRKYEFVKHVFSQNPKTIGFNRTFTGLTVTLIHEFLSITSLPGGYLPCFNAIRKM